MGYESVSAIGSHERPNEGATNIWLTPRWIIDALGPFDLDPCAAPEPRPFSTAKRHIVEAEDGLSQDWGDAFVWMNPPYGPHVGKWLDKIIKHGNGIALVFARTETPPMQEALRRSDARLFMGKRVTFLRPDGSKAPGNSGAPSVLLAFGKVGTLKLWEAQYSFAVPGVLL